MDSSINLDILFPKQTLSNNSKLVGRRHCVPESSPQRRASFLSIGSCAAMSAPTGHVPYHDAAQRVGDSYFTDFRKGEVNELMEMLRQAHNDKTGVKLVDTVKRVVAYMTLGIDVSRLFSQMVMVP